MADWNKNFENINLDPDFLAIRSLFESGYIKRMALLKEQSPTKIAKLLGLQYNSYLDKLDFPEKFLVKHIYLLALSCQIDPNIIFNIIQKETQTRIAERLL